MQGGDEAERQQCHLEDLPTESPVRGERAGSDRVPGCAAFCAWCEKGLVLTLPWNNDPRKLPSAGNSGGTAARNSVSHTGSRTAPRHQCPNADCGPGQTCIRATRTTARTASLPETNTLYTIPRAHAASCCSLRVRAPAPPGRRLLRHAGISEALVKRASFERWPRLRGSVHPLACRRPRHLGRYPCLHLTVEWTEPVRGPLALGAGTGYGLGLFVPVGEGFLGLGRGDVEGN